MAHILVENGRDFCPVTNVRVRDANGVEHGVPGQGGPAPSSERVSFLIPPGKWPSIQCYSQHALRDEQGKSRGILITSVGVVGVNGALVEAVVQPS